MQQKHPARAHRISLVTIGASGYDSRFGAPGQGAINRCCHPWLHVLGDSQGQKP